LEWSFSLLCSLQKIGTIWKEILYQRKLWILLKTERDRGLPDHIQNFDGETQGYLNVNKLRRGTKIRKS